MSTQGELTREQAVAMAGEDAVDEVGRKNCEPTGRVGYNGKFQGDDWCEWSASVACQDKDGIDCVLTVYYYTDNEQDQIMADNSGDGSYIDWEIEGYEIKS